MYCKYWACFGSGWWMFDGAPRKVGGGKTDK